MISRGKPSFEYISSNVSEITLAAYYFGINKIPCLINSPIRKDSRPSFGFYSSEGKTVGWTDFATKDKGGSLYKLLSLMWQCPLSEVYQRILSDLPKIKSSAKIKKVVTKIKKTLSSNKDVIMACKIRPWKDYDIKYWKSYGISLPSLKYAEVYPISHKIIFKDNKKYTFGADKYAYAFVEHKEGNVTLKIYQPFNKNGFKWANKHDSSVISLWTKVPKKGNLITICSSLKDALCLYENLKIPAVAIQGEGYSISPTAISELKKRFKNVFVLLDNDAVGIKDAKKLCEHTGFKNIELPQFEGGKDISDYYKTFGKDCFIKTIKSLFEEQLKIN